MFPIRDDNTGRIRTPYVTYALIALNVIVFVFLQGIGTNESFTYAFSTIPQEIRTGTDVAENVTSNLAISESSSRSNTRRSACTSHC